MNPAWLDDMSWAMAEVYASCTDRILVNLARHFPFVRPGAKIPGSFEYQARMLAQMGQVNRETAAIIASYLGGADQALQDALRDAILEGLKSEEPALRRAAADGFLNTPARPQVEPGMMQAFQSYYRQSADRLNLVNTVMLESTQAAYTATVADIANRIQATQSALNVAAGEVVTGVSTFNQALHTAVGKMVDNGLTGFIDHAGRRWSPEAYVAMDIRTTMANTARSAVWERNQEYGNDLYLVSSHDGARPLCYPWQGKIISTTGRTGTTTDLDGNTYTIHSEDEIESFRYGGGLFGVNCGHYPMVWIPGFSTMKGHPQDEEANAKQYEESQQQRALERRLREEKRDLDVMRAQGAPEEQIKAQRERVRHASADIDDFCEETGRTRRRDREGTPARATWPDPDTYDPTTFPIEERDRILGGMRNQRGNAEEVVTGAPDVQPIGPIHAEYTPARTIQEAEEQARQFIAYGGSVSYRGIDLQYANTCNRVLGDIQASYDVRPIGSVQPMNMRTKLFRDTTAEAAYRWGGIGGDLFINPTYYKSVSTFASHMAEIDRLTQTVLGSGEKLLERATGAKREYIQALLSTGRQCVAQSHDFVEATFVHECGHRLDDNLFHRMLREVFGGSNVGFADRLAESRHRYGANISGYAVTSNQEYIAESFAAWWYGEGDRIDPVIRSVFEGALRNGGR
jgi:hypothetical protein